jgi:2-polyprenyl-6-hydroxyphenyl methylase/3-demethylubiquinone-9 3-methyltransferase
MKDYYEELWERLPDELEPPDLDRRLRILQAELRPGDRALDLGCGEGTFTQAMADAGATATGVDVAEAALRRARLRHPDADFRLAPIDGPIPLTDGELDLVWASEVIEHVADTERWLTEVTRVLAPGGRLLITTPDHPRLGLALHGVERYSEPFGDHLHLYTRRSLGRTLDETGFRHVDVRAVGGVPALRRMLVSRAERG